jgi:hypothetical protein
MLQLLSPPGVPLLQLLPATAAQQSVAWAWVAMMRCHTTQCRTHQRAMPIPTHLPQERVAWWGWSTRAWAPGAIDAKPPFDLQCCCTDNKPEVSHTPYVYACTATSVQGPHSLHSVISQTPTT